jgi:serine/threonine protein kinase
MNKNINKNFIVQCYDTFQDAENLYFVMEFLPGGDLHTQRKHGCLSTLQKVKFYFCEILLAIETLHKNDVVYRDLKLDNVMVASDGHTKVLLSK